MSKNYCAKVENGVVTEVIVADCAWATANLEGDWHDLGGEPLTVGVGYLYDAELDEFSVVYHAQVGDFGYISDAEVQESEAPTTDENTQPA